MKKQARRLVGCALFGAVLGSAQGSDGWFSGRDYRQQITVDQNYVSGSGAHTNYPVLITASNVKPELWQHAQTNGADIVFTAANGTTRLAHEIERYDAAASNLWAWVKVPELAGTADTSFYMYYGYPLPIAAQEGTGVWTDYRAVWHLREASGTRFDSTANDADAAATGAVSLDANGKIGGACGGFDGVTQAYLSATKQVVNSNGTVSAWVKMPASLSSGHAIFDTGYNAGTLIRQYGSGGNAMEVWVHEGSTANITDSSYFAGTENAWVYVTLVMNNGTASLYRNGQWKKNGTYTGTPVGPAWAYLGVWNSGDHKWSGSIDETRVCREVRSADWIATEYANQSTPASFATAAAEERVSSAASSSPWYQSWGYRQLLFVEASQVSGGLSNFPALVTEQNVRSDLWQRAKTDGSDILFTAGDGTTKLAHELETYNSATTQLCAWVSLPSVSAASNTPFYVYYGRVDAANQGNPAGVWAGYRAVWHLRETSGTRYDSTSTDADVAPSGGVSHTASGRMNGACAFDGSTGYLTANKQVINGNGSVSAWVKMPSSLTAGHAIFDAGYNTGTLIRQNAVNTMEAWVRNGSTATITDATYFTGTESTWIYVTLVMNNGTASLYRNGQYRKSGTYAGTPSNPWLQIGRYSTQQYWNGLIDETRVATDALSAEWIATEYRNQTSPSAFTFSCAEEARPPRGSTLVIR